MTNLMDRTEAISQLRALEQQLEGAHKFAQGAETRKASLENYIDKLDELQLIYKENKLDKPILPFHNTNTASAPIRKRSGKPNTQVFEEILSLNKEPMHITDILASALNMGIEFQGNTDPKTQLRNSLNGAKKRFYNIGNNTWWIVGRPIPGEQAQTEFNEMIHDQ